MTARRMVWQYIEARDHRVMRRVNRWRAPRWLRVWMIWASRLGDGWIWYSVGITLLFWSNILPPDQFSFPSGHSMSAFAIAIPLCIFYPDLQAALLVLAFSIAISRVILGMHFVSDVVVGSLLGAGLGYGAYQLFH